MAENRNKKNKAQAMVVVFVYISIISLIGIYMMLYASQLNNLVFQEINHTRAIYAGEAGLITALLRFYNNLGVANVALPNTPATVTVTATPYDQIQRITATIANWRAWTVAGTGTTIALTTFYPEPFAEYFELTTRELRDLGNAPLFEFGVDPDGVSQLADVRLAGPDTFPTATGNGDLLIEHVMYGTSGQFYIDLNNSPTTPVNSMMYVQSVVVGTGPAGEGTLTMGAPSPSVGIGGMPIGGKHVYDIAEGISAEEACEAGDVVVISDTAQTVLAKSMVAFSNRVAGVISEDPKLYMGPGQGKMPLALAGIVRCKAIAENGPIKRGDLLVCSSLPGHAMAATPQQVKPGMLIGKALEQLEQGTGAIFILVGKQ